MKHDIFISYRRAEREFVASVVRRLEARGVSCWYDADIEGGAAWKETTAAELAESGMLAVFFSGDSNSSGQLRKELALADKLGKPVVPVLLEDVQPRGANLHELADRNWIKLFPDPPARIEELVDLLSVLSGKAEAAIATTVPANDGHPVIPEKPLDQAVGEFIDGADGGTRPAPKVTAAYVGRVGAEGDPIRPYNDILPFKVIDLAFLVPIWLFFGLYAYSELTRGADDAMRRATPIALAILEVLITGLYGAVVFPIRYYLRRRSAMSALRAYLISSAIMLAIIFIAFFGALSQGLFTTGSPMTAVTNFLGSWAIFTVIAFVIYGVLSGQRAIRSFRMNLRKL